MAHDREVGGVRCREVLDLLPDYVDDELDTVTRVRIESHLRGCDWCERFGGRYAQTVGELRTLLAEPAPLEAPVANRLRARLSEKMETGRQAEPGSDGE